MAEIIEKVTGKVKTTAKKVGKKATELASTTKQTILLQTKNMELGKKMKLLGECYYAFVRAEGTAHEEEAKLAECLSAVDALKAEVADLKREIAKAKGNIACPKCGEYVSPSKETCPKCKSSLEHIAVTPKK